MVISNVVFIFGENKRKMITVNLLGFVGLIIAALLWGMFLGIMFTKDK